MDMQSIASPGDLCIAAWPFPANRLNPLVHDETEVYILLDGDSFIMLDLFDIKENNTLEFHILYENMKMWFNIRMHNYIIANVRSVESYDIPFMTLQEAEPGSNNSTS